MHSLKFHTQTILALLAFSSLPFFECGEYDKNKQTDISNTVKNDSAFFPAPVKYSLQLDTARYNAKLLYLAHNKPGENGPVKTAYTLNGSILPFRRVVAYYGNFYSKGMGILGEMLNKLQQEVKKWHLADTLTPVLPALHYIDITAQRNAGKDRKYRLRMPFSQVDKALQLV